MDRESILNTARHVLAQRLESLHSAGVQQLGIVPPSMPAAPAKPALPATTSPLAPPAAPLPPPRAATETPMPRKPAAAPVPSLNSLLAQPYPDDLPDSAADRQRLLDELNEQVRPCVLCRELATGRKQTVFGVGSPKPRVAFFGEAPGADEDRLGEPFVGRAGQLLTKIIEACGWQRSDVYILNVLKCRPPDNRNPLPPEVDHCRPFFERQLEILRPEYIVCVGTVPSQALLETTEAVGKLRGRMHSYRNSRVLVTYHPSYLLRNPSAKKYVWDDMQFLLKEMGLPVPKRQ